MSLQQTAEVTIRTVATGIDLVVVLIVASAVVRTLWLYALAFLQRELEPRTREIRLGLGIPIILALEFLIGADILRTSIAPTWTIIGQLAAIILLRTLLNYLLEWELGLSDRIRKPPGA